MAKIQLICSIYFLLVVPGVVLSQTDEAAVRQLLLSDAAAFERNDMSTIEKHWANDDSVVVFESGHANYGWSDYKNNHLGPELAEMKNLSYKLSDIKVKAGGGLAYATFKYAISADLKERHIEVGGVGTAVLEKRGENWLIIHWHSSSPRRQQPQTQPNQPQSSSPEAQKNYVGHSKEECARIQVTCIPGFERFDDDKGCGCKKTR